jgi:hypothetical protein
MREALTIHHYGGNLEYEIALMDPPVPVSEAGETPVIMIQPSDHATVPAFMEGDSSIVLQQHLQDGETIHLAHSLAIPIRGYILNTKHVCELHGISYIAGKGDPCIHALWAMDSAVDEPNHRVGYKNEDNLKTLIFTSEKAYWVEGPMCVDDPKAIVPGIFATATPIN